MIDTIVNSAVKQIGSFDYTKNVVITAIFGDYDDLYEIPEGLNEFIFFCFTDNPLLKSKSWNIIYIKDLYIDPRRTAKIFKILPHKIFYNSNVTIWIDANRLILSPFKNIILNQSLANLSFYHHPKRDCIYEEARECIKWGKDLSSNILEQVEMYKKDGYPQHNGLICGAFFIRPINPLMNKLFDDWWYEVEKRSIRDQLSFNYVIWKNSIEVNYINGDINDNSNFKTMTHNKFVFYNVGIIGKFKNFISFIVFNILLLKRKVKGFL